MPKVNATKGQTAVADVMFTIPLGAGVSDALHVLNREMLHKYREAESPCTEFRLSYKGHMVCGDTLTVRYRATTAPRMKGVDMWSGR